MRDMYHQQETAIFTALLRGVGPRVGGTGGNLRESWGVLGKIREDFGLLGYLHNLSYPPEQPSNM